MNIFNNFNCLNLGDLRNVINDNFNNIKGLEVISGRVFYNGVQLYCTDDLWFVGDVNYPISAEYNHNNILTSKDFFSDINNKGNVLLKFQLKHNNGSRVYWDVSVKKQGSSYIGMYNGYGNDLITKELQITNLNIGDKVWINFYTTYSGGYNINNLQYFAGNNPNCIRIGGIE